MKKEQMPKQLHSNVAVLKYFIGLVTKLSPWYIPALVIQSIAKSITPLILIIGPKLIVDELTGGKDVEVLMTIIGVMAIGSAVFNSVSKYLEYKVKCYTEKFGNDFESYISAKTVDIDFENIEDPDVLNLKERALFAVRNHGLIRGMVEGLSKVVNESILMLSLTALIWTFSPWVIGLLILVVAINSFIFKRVQYYYYKESTDSVGGNRAFVYFITGSRDLEIAKDLRLYGMVPLFIKKMDAYNKRVYEVYSVMYSAIGRLNGMASGNVQLQTVLIYGFLAYRTLAGSLTIGNFMMYAGAIGKFSQSMNTLVSSVIEVNRQCRQLELLLEYDQIPPSTAKGTAPVQVQENYEIRFENVWFQYPRAEDYTLKNISLTIKPGEKMSIIGLNGAGKTTFVKLLTRLYAPTKGVITLNGVDIQTLRYKDYMDTMAAVFQDFRLFGLSAEENVTGVLPDDKNHPRVEEYLRQAGVWEDIDALPNKLSTNLDKRFDKEGTKLSGGQAQKIAISRALYKDAPIVILDEPTAAIDPLAEHDVYCRFDELVGGKTAIYISHRLSSCRFCDRIVVFHGGEIIQVGNHDQLIQEKGGQYETMYSAQAEYYVAG